MLCLYCIMYTNYRRKKNRLCRLLYFFHTRSDRRRLVPSSRPMRFFPSCILSILPSCRKKALSSNEILSFCFFSRLFFSKLFIFIRSPVCHCKFSNLWCPMVLNYDFARHIPPRDVYSVLTKKESVELSMKDYIEERVLELAHYIISTNATVRTAAKNFGFQNLRCTKTLRSGLN